MVMMGLAIGLYPAQPACAADARFTVTDVAVDVTGDSAEAAKEKALNEGQHQAFQQLLRNLGVAEGSIDGLKVGDNDLLRMVQGLEVANEKISANRYRAKLTVGFREGRVRAFLRQANLTINDSVAQQDGAGDDGTAAAEDGGQAGQAGHATTSSGSVAAGSSGDHARARPATIGADQTELAGAGAGAAGGKPLVLTLQISNFVDWLRAKQQLQRVPGLYGLRVAKLNQSQAELTAFWNGGTNPADQLSNYRFEVSGGAGNLNLRYRP